MNIRLEQLKSHLRDGALSVYLVTGDEPFQLAECQDVIRSYARTAGFTERLVFDVQAGFDWSELYQACNTLSLFASRQLIEVRLNNFKLGDAGTRALLEYFANPSPDNILLLSAPKLDGNVKKTKWFKALDASFGVIQVWPLEYRDLPGWIARRAKSKDVHINAEGARLLAERVEGNLLAAAQEIEKLALLYPGQEITLEEVANAAADSAQYDVFSLVDTVLAGDAARYAKMLNNLQSSGIEPPVVLWAFSREIRVMAQMSGARAAGDSIDQILKNYRIWGKRSNAVRAGLERLKPGQWYALLRRAAQIDRMIKGMETGNCWDELLKLGFAITGTRILRAE